jgi:cytochrome c oxidase subunit 2
VGAGSEEAVVATELRWSLVIAAVTAVIFGAIFWAAVAMERVPPSNGAVIDPKALHVSGEFAEANLGTQVDAAGAVVSRIVTAQFQFTPSCIVVPQGHPVTLRFSSPDVIHGILVVGTNVNTMVVPGYISQVRTVFNRTGDLLMPCHEFCGLGHSQMLATVRVVHAADFKPGPDGKVACAQR